MMDQLKVRIEFGGGTEFLFDNKKSLDLELPGKDDWTIEKLIKHLSDNYVKERVELFCSGDKIRPGILILVNDTDYLLLEGPKYKLKNNDTILFISTLHGG